VKIINIIILYMASLLTVSAALPAEKATLRGKVTDAIDGSALIGVSISVPDVGESAVTDANGCYILSGLPRKRVTLQVSYIGHQTIIRDVDLAKDQKIDFIMQESNATLNEIVVTGLTGRALMKDSPTPISVVTERELQAASSTNVIDALSHQAGISQISTGSGISKPVIRGLSHNRIVTVNDGVRQEGQQWGDEHGIEIDAQSVGQVEILKGPASLIYGSDAMAGVVVFYGEPMLPQGKMTADVSSEYQTNNGLFAYSARFAGNKSGFLWNIRYSDKMAHAYKNKLDGYVLNSQFRERAVTSMLGLNRTWGHSRLNLSYWHLKPGIVEGERDETTGQFTTVEMLNGEETDVVATEKQLKKYGVLMPFQQVRHYKAVLNNTFFVGDGTLKAIIGYQQNRRQEFEEVAEPDVCGLDFQLHTINYDLRYTPADIAGWQLTGGVGGMFQRSLNHGEEFLIPAYCLFDVGSFVTANRKSGRWVLSGGVRADNRHLHSFALADRFSRISRNFFGFTGSAGAVFRINDNANARLNVARGFRAPNLSELASNGEHEGTLRYELGNSALQPEYSWQIDAGIDFSSPVISMEAALFANFIDNYIFSSRNGDVDESSGHAVFQYTQGDARLMGFELNVDVHPVERVHFQNTFSYVDAVQLHQPKDRKYLPFTPPAKLSSELRFDILRDNRGLFNNTYCQIGADVYFRQNHFYAAEDTETATPSYTLLSASAGTDVQWHRHKVASVYLIGDNLTDRAYQSHLSRLKYADFNVANGRKGVFNMGRNVTLKVVIPINL